MVGPTIYLSLFPGWVGRSAKFGQKRGRNFIAEPGTFGMTGLGNGDHKKSNTLIFGDKNEEGMRVVSGFAEIESNRSSNANSCCSFGE